MLSVVVKLVTWLLVSTRITATVFPPLLHVGDVRLVAA
jgi:hypothetical protein